MNAPRNECPLDQQAVGWTLHALEPDEEVAVLLHLPHCASCQDAVLGAEQVLSGLGAAVEQVEPPPSLRAALMSSVSGTPQRPSILPPRLSPEDAPAGPEHPDRPAQLARRHRLDAESAAERRAGRSWMSRNGRRLVAASLVLIAALGIGGLVARNSQLEQQRDVETAQAQSLTDLVSRLTQPGTRHALLATTAGTTVAAVLLADGRRQVYTVGLPTNQADNIYVLWGISGAEAATPEPLGTFDVAAADQGVRTVGSLTEAEGYETYAISIEPGRVAPASPSDVVASGQVNI